MVLRETGGDYMVLDRNSGEKIHVTAENRAEYADRGRYIRLQNEPVPDSTPDPVAKATEKAAPAKKAAAKKRSTKKS